VSGEAYARLRAAGQLVEEGRRVEAHIEAAALPGLLARGRRYALRARGRGVSRRLGLNEARFVPASVGLG
jgi:hypothetical protein